jgi:hypothetical protein
LAGIWIPSSIYGAGALQTIIFQIARFMARWLAQAWPGIAARSIPRPNAVVGVLVVGTTLDIETIFGRFLTL